MKIALVSCATKRAEKIKQMVQSAHGSFHGLKVYLIMQGENLQGAMLRAVSKVTWIKLKSGVGTAKGLNRAIRSALKNGADLIVICHPDVKFEGDAIKHMVDSWESADNPGLIGPFTDNAQSKVGQTVHDPAFRGEGLVRKSHLGGFCFLTSRKVIAEVGLFDERCPPNFGWDVDYCLRVKIAGYNLYLDQGAYVHHIRWDTDTDFGQEEGNGIKFLEDKYGADKMHVLTGEVELSEEDRTRAQEALTKAGKLEDYSGFEHYVRK